MVPVRAWVRLSMSVCLPWAHSAHQNLSVPVSTLGEASKRNKILGDKDDR